MNATSHTNMYSSLEENNDTTSVKSEWDSESGSDSSDSESENEWEPTAEIEPEPEVKVAELKGRKGRKKIDITDLVLPATSYERRPRQMPTVTKEEQVEQLTCTQACRNVVVKCYPVVGEDGKVVLDDYGRPQYSRQPVLTEDGQYQFVRVCHRKVCTFAHSYHELRMPPCKYGGKCRRIDGLYHYKSNSWDTRPEKKCQFIHPTEDMYGYLKRTMKELPLLPLTSEVSHQPNEEGQGRGQGKQGRGQDKQGRVTTISVPNQELAREALESALARGFTNVRVIVNSD